MMKFYNKIKLFHLASVFQLIAHDHWSDTEPLKLAPRKTMRLKIHHAHVGDQIEIRRVLHVGVEVHIAPTDVKGFCK